MGKCPRHAAIGIGAVDGVVLAVGVAVGAVGEAGGVALEEAAEGGGIGAVVEVDEAGGVVVGAAGVAEAAGDGFRRLAGGVGDGLAAIGGVEADLDEVAGTVGCTNDGAEAVGEQAQPGGGAGTAEERGAIGGVPDVEALGRGRRAGGVLGDEPVAVVEELGGDAVDGFRGAAVEMGGSGTGFSEPGTPRPQGVGVIGQRRHDLSKWGTI